MLILAPAARAFDPAITNNQANGQSNHRNRKNHDT
jgi:hypothetical protein